ncbi:MAG: hypothetical protein GY784_11115 [Gammaproteobacteria bacterium]|nr:hypothetical protein [Gammaproteobacteria bacterium]
MNHSTRRPRKTRSQWQDIITDFNHSHLPARTFCSNHDLAYGTFAKWRNRLAKPSQNKTKPAKLIELIQPTSSQSVTDNWHVELELGNGMTLRLKTA